jgi:hypothetical protein
MLWSLIQGWCGDVAAALASHANDVEPSVQLAANAAAGRWSAVVSEAPLEDSGADLSRLFSDAKAVHALWSSKHVLCRLHIACPAGVGAAW